MSGSKSIGERSLGSSSRDANQMKSVFRMASPTTESESREGEQRMELAGKISPGADPLTSKDKLSLAGLSAEQVRALWSKTYNRDGKPDWSHIFPYYCEDVVFKDSIQEVHGIEEFKALCERLTKRSKQLQMAIPSIVIGDDCIFMQWEMTMMFKKYPSSTVYGATRLGLDDEGRILTQRDYYDLWGDIFDNIPWFARPYRRFMHRKFG